jgi:hypothetical protein
MSGESRCAVNQSAQEVHMFRSFEGTSDVTVEMNNLCLQLFDRWCETRSVIPFAYLMKAWPIAVPDPPSMMHLSDVLRNLTAAHSDCLETDERQIAEKLIGVAKEMYM